MEGPGAGPAEAAPPGSVEAAAATAAAFTTAAAAAAVAATEEEVDDVEVEESETVDEEGRGSTACPAFLRILRRRRVKYFAWKISLISEFNEVAHYIITC